MPIAFETNFASTNEALDRGFERVNAKVPSSRSAIIASKAAITTPTDANMATNWLYVSTASAASLRGSDPLLRSVIKTKSMIPFIIPIQIKLVHSGVMPENQSRSSLCRRFDRPLHRLSPVTVIRPVDPVFDVRFIQAHRLGQC